MARNSNDKRHRPAKTDRGTAPSEKNNNRNYPVPVRTLPLLRNSERHFDMIVDGVPYSIRSKPFSFNEELRFRICINGGAEHVFTWDSQAAMLRAIDDESSTIPVGLEEAVSRKLQSR